MVKQLLPLGIFNALSRATQISEITEIRLRINKPIVFQTKFKREILKMQSGVTVLARKEDIEYVLLIASNNSLYSINDELVKGYLHFEGGIRIGACGEAVVDEDKILTLKKINFLCIRFPHEILGCSNQIMDSLKKNKKQNVLIVSPPGCGKTTMLRDLARQFSERCHTLIIDERFEIAGSIDGVPSMDVGNCDVLSGIGKLVAIENTVRAMSPEIIIVDELFTKSEIDAVENVRRSGVGIFASVHARDLYTLQNSETFKDMLKIFDAKFVLSKDNIGEISEVSID